MASQPPTGTVTFLFTDLEGSTRLLRDIGRERYEELLGIHRRLMREAVESSDGYFVDNAGRRLLRRLPQRRRRGRRRAPSAQRAHSTHPWPSDAVAARAHGPAHRRRDPRRRGYIGLAVHHGARIGAAGDGGQVLLSSLTARLVAHQLPRRRAAARRRRSGRSATSTRPEQLFELVIDGTPGPCLASRRDPRAHRGRPGARAQRLPHDPRDAEGTSRSSATPRTALQAVRLAEELRPDVVLMDIRMPELDGLEATRRVLALPHAPRVLVLTTFDMNEYVLRGDEGAAPSGFLLKDTRPEALIDAVRTVAHGDALLAPTITRRLIEEFTSRPSPGRTRPAGARSCLDERELADPRRSSREGLCRTPRSQTSLVDCAEPTVAADVATRSSPSSACATARRPSSFAYRTGLARSAR